MKNLILIFIASVFTINCSMVRARWYSKPPSKYKDSGDGISVDVAAINQSDIKIIVWSHSTIHPILMGIPFIPVWPIDQPILENPNITMEWKIIVPESIKNKWIKVSVASLSVKINTGKVIGADRVSTYSYHPQKKGSRVGYYRNDSLGSNKLSEYIEFRGTTTFRIDYKELYYKSNKWHEQKPVLIIDGKKLKVPALRFRPAKDYSYSPLESPFYFAPVR